MVGQYLKKIIAKSTDDLQFISACCYKAKVKISDIKYLPINKIFIISLERYNRETEEKKNKTNKNKNRTLPKFCHRQYANVNGSIN